MGYEGVGDGVGVDKVLRVGKNNEKIEYSKQKNRKYKIIMTINNLHISFIQ